MAERYFEDFTVGESIELGSVQISAAEIIAFAEQFDPQPFHVDPARAEGSVFGGLIASGWHTAGLYMRLFAEGVLNRVPSFGSPGMHAWHAPIRTATVRERPVARAPGRSLTVAVRMPGWPQTRRACQLTHSPAKSDRQKAEGVGAVADRHGHRRR